MKKTITNLAIIAGLILMLGAAGNADIGREFLPNFAAGMALLVAGSVGQMVSARR